MTTIQGTALDLFQTTLTTNLNERDALKGRVEVVLSVDELAESFPTEAVWWGDSETDVEIPLMKSGTKKIDEQVSTELIVQVLLIDGRSQADANAFATEILAEIQQELAETPGQIDVPTFVAEMRSWRRHVGVIVNKNNIPIGNGCRYECQIWHRARLQPDA